MKSLMGAFLVAGAIAAPAAIAQPTEKDCVSMTDKMERLDCYDRLHHRAPDAAPVVPPAAAVPAAPAALPLRGSTTFTESWDLDGKNRGLVIPRPYRPMYVLVGDWTDNIDRMPSSPSPGHSVTSPLVLRPIEAKYQISFKSKLVALPWDMSLWAAYTQSSRWQVYNPADSRPFRETNYEPEIFVVKPLEWEVPGAGGKLRMVSLGYDHQSNGRALPLSRSWNRIVGSAVYENGPWRAEVRPWVRLHESLADDDNPDISDYAGRGELRLSRRFDTHLVSVVLRHSLRSGSRSHGSAQLDYVFPIPGYDALHGQVQLFTGYAESMIDYNVRQTRVGIGLTIGGWQ